MKTLHLTLKKKWFDMILSGEKTEEYRETKPYWVARLIVKGSVKQTDTGCEITFKNFDKVHFYNGASPSLKYPNFIIEFKGVSFGKAKPEWSDNAQGDFFVIKLGNVIMQPISKQTHLQP